MQFDINALEDLIKGEESIQSVDHKLNQKKIVDQQNQLNDKYNLIRYLTIVIDLSFSMNQKDFKPNRFQNLLNNLKQFVPIFLKKNPLSQICILNLQEGICLIKHKFTMDSNKLVNALDSLQVNCLEQMQNVYQDLPLYQFKESLFFLSNNTSKDHGNIFEDIKKVAEMNISVNIIHLGGQVHLCQKIANLTKGQFIVPKNSPDLSHLIQSFMKPPPPSKDQLICQSLEISFPSKHVNQHQQLCSCCNQLRSEYYCCSKCKAFVCNIPTKCPVCRIALTGQADLTRIQIQNQRQPGFELNYLDNGECSYCQEKGEFMQEYSKYVYSRCKICQTLFCLDCDIYLHSNVHKCPGCF